MSGPKNFKFDFEYPKQDPNGLTIDSIEIDLIHVRAVDSIVIRFDFERNGYVIYQASRFSWPDGEPFDPDWAEVAFIGAFARAEPGTFQEDA